MAPDSPAIARIPAGYRSKLSPKAVDTIEKVFQWVETECLPAEDVMRAQLRGDRWKVQPLMRELREKAKAAGLFNLFLPKSFKESPGFTNFEYACMAEIMGRVYWAAEVEDLVRWPTHRIPLTLAHRR